MTRSASRVFHNLTNFNDIKGAKLDPLGLGHSNIDHLVSTGLAEVPTPIMARLKEIYITGSPRLPVRRWPPNRPSPVSRS